MLEKAIAMDGETPRLWTSTDDATVLHQALGDCDCACPEAPFEVVTPVSAEAIFSTLPDTLIQPLKDGFYLAFSPLAPAGPSVINRAACDRYHTFAAHPQGLTQPIDRQLAQQNLLVPTPAPRPQPAPKQQLTAWLHITNACNLDCPYCYVRKSSETMPLAVGYQALESLVAAASQRRMAGVKLKYAGGEATLQMPLVQQLQARAIALTQQAGLELQSVLLTNGVALSQRWIDWLICQRLRVMVSLDGVAPIQDYQRPRPGGGRSFEQVVSTIDRMVASGLRPHISITLTAASAPYAASLVAWVLQQKLTFHLNFYRQTALNADPAQWASEENALIAGLRACYRAIEADLPSYPLFGGLLDKMQTQAHTHTCGVNHNYVVVTHRGQLAQCQMHLHQPIGAFNPDFLDQIQTGPIHNLPVEEKEGCQTCPYRYRCTGGCPLETHQATGRWDVKSPHCNIYRTLYPEVLRLEGLRLLAIHGE